MDYPFIFVDESGVSLNTDDRQPYFGVGMLKVQDPYPFTVDLLNTHFANYSNLRSQRRTVIKDLKASPKVLTQDELNMMLASTRHYEYKFTDVTPDKLDKYLRFLDTALKHKFEFHCVVIDKDHPRFLAEIHSNFWDAYIHYCKQLCQSNCRAEERATIIADFNHKPNASNQDFSTELRSLSCINNAIMLQSVGTPLIQLCDILLGAAIFRYRITHKQIKDSNRAKSKAQFTNYLFEKLGLDLTEDDLKSGIKIKTDHDQVFSTMNPWP